MKLRVRFEDVAKEDLKAARATMGGAVREGLKEAAQRAVLPAAKRAAPAIVAQALTTKATMKGAYLTTLGPRKGDDITGLLNFGGSPQGVIRPRKAQALRLRGTTIVVETVGQEGRPRARYKGGHFLELAISRSVPLMEAITYQKIMNALHARGLS